MTVTLIRFSAPAPGLACYLAVRTADVHEILARFPHLFVALLRDAGYDARPGDVAAHSLDWSVLPGTERLVAGPFAAITGEKPWALLGTTQHGQWKSWYLPGPPPPPPNA